ncbi:MAG TPA: Asp23/Gls24 family envelope stress response protein [Trebonia sp.]
MPAEHPLDTASLPCGADTDLLLEQAAEGRGADRDDHQQHCVHCQAALGEFAAVWEPVAELAATPVPAPPGLVSAVMSQVNRLVHDIWYTLEVSELGAVRIAARIVGALARDSARMIPGVRVALGRSTYGPLAALAEKATFGHRHPHAAVGVLGRTAVVDLAVAVGYDDQGHQVAREIQRHVRATLRDQVGLRDVTVNVTVDDVIDDADSR